MERREKRFASRILAWFLTFLMITTMIPTSAFAALPAQDTGAVVSEDASSDETTQDGILLKTTLTDKLKVKGQRKLFDVWARDAEDNTLKPTATLDGQVLSATWSDNVKTSFTLDFQGMEEGEHTVVISAEKAGERAMKCDAALSVTYTGNTKEQLDNMLTALDSVIGVLILSAGMLAFVVLYNLNNININERKRELATIKVLGFYDKEVSAYVYRENILLTILGSIFGIFLGILLHRFIIVTVEVDVCMFGRNISVFSYVISALITYGFSILVNGVMYFKLKKIDMVESLKSVE